VNHGGSDVYGGGGKRGAPFPGGAGPVGTTIGEEN